jgi:hypothetical protein
LNGSGTILYDRLKSIVVEKGELMKTWLNVVCAGIAVFGLSACGGGGGDDESSPVNSFNFADLNNSGYGVEFDDGDAYIAFGCGKFTWYEDGNYHDEGTYELVGNRVEVNSTLLDEDAVLETSAAEPGVLKVGQTYVVTDYVDMSYDVKVTWMQEDTQTCMD